MSAPRPSAAWIPLHPSGLTWPAPSVLETLGASLQLSVQDQLQRPLQDLRISVTDRCNFRCGYCMPKAVFDAHYPYLPRPALLRFEEITRAATQCLALGVRKLRLTGGEPLLRRELPTLVRQLAALRRPDGAPPDLAMTTNGALLARHAAALRDAGLQRLTVSLDAMDAARFRQLNDMDVALETVLDGIDTARRAGFEQIKINMVVQRGLNDDQILPVAAHFRGTGIPVRFIEYMDVGASNGWQRAQVLPSSEVLQRLQAAHPMVPLAPSAPGETATRWGYADARGHHDAQAGEIGLISSVTQPFCGDCRRARLSPEGKLYLCLFASQGWDLRHWLRQGSNDALLRGAIAHAWGLRADRYSERRSAPTSNLPLPRTGRVEMSYIGG